MKNAPFLAGICAVLGAGALLARADNSAPVNLKSTTPMQAPIPPIAPTPAPPISSIDFSTSDDPEQVAEQTMALHQQQQDNPIPDLDAYDKQQQQQAYDNDWMLRNYTALLKKQGMADTPETDPSRVPQPADPNATSAYQDPLLPENQPKPEKSNQSRANSNTDPSSQLTPSSSLSPIDLQPLLAPLNPQKRTTPHDAWGSPDSLGDMSATDASDTFQTAPTPDLGNSDSPGSLLDSPGMTAQQQGLTKFNDLNLQDPDPMPDVVNTDRAAQHVNRNNNFLVPTAPTSDVAEFFKKQSEALAPPTAPTAARPVGSTAPLKPLPPIDAPMPFARPPSNNLRSHVDDPFDILNR